MKDFTLYPEALALKELGFDEPCFGYYIELRNPKEGILTIGKCEKNSHGIIIAPTYSQAFRFFREKYGLYSSIDGLEMRQYYKITQTNEYSKEYNTYEEAELACLRKLIEIVKSKSI